VQLQQGTWICSARGSGNDEIFPSVVDGLPDIPSPDTEQWPRTRESFACKTSNNVTRPIKHQREGRGLHEKPRPSMTSRLLGRKEAASLRRPKLRRPTKATVVGAVYDANGRRRPAALHCSDTVADWVFTILTFVRWPSLNYKRGGWHHEHGRRTRQDEKQHTTLTEHQLLSLTYRDLGLLPSLDLSLYSLLQAPLWAYRTLS
jgi:hypothetical protein